MMWMDYLAIAFLTSLILTLLVKMVYRTEPAMRQLIRDVDAQPIPVTATQPLAITTRR